MAIKSPPYVGHLDAKLASFTLYADKKSAYRSRSLTARGKRELAFWMPMAALGFYNPVFVLIAICTRSYAHHVMGTRETLVEKILDVCVIFVFFLAIFISPMIVQELMDQTRVLRMPRKDGPIWVDI